MNKPMKICGELSFSAAEAVRLLRSNLEYSVSDVTGCRVLGVTGALRGEGRTVTAVNLAWSLAESGKKVLLLDADLRSGQAASMLGLSPDRGLTQVLRGEISFEEAQQPGGIEGLYVLAAGGSAADPAALLNSDAMRRLIGTLRERFDYILMDLPPVTVVSDALSAAESADGMLVVIRRGQTRRRELENTLRTLDGQRVKVLGLVLNG